MTIVMFVLTAQVRAVAQENVEPPAVNAPEQRSTDARTDSRVAKPEDEKQKKQAVTAGMLLLVGVVLIGLVLIGMTIAWGGRLRRMARKPLPQPKPVDELWYLKAKKAPGGEAAAPTSGDNVVEPDGPERS